MQPDKLALQASSRKTQVLSAPAGTPDSGLKLTRRAAFIEPMNKT